MRPGPKPRADTDRRSHRVSVYLTPAEYAELTERAGDAGIAAHLRAAGLNRRAPTESGVPQLNREAYQQLARLAANLNQRQKQINFGLTVGSSDEVGALRHEVAALRRELLGLPT